MHIKSASQPFMTAVLLMYMYYLSFPKLDTKYTVSIPAFYEFQQNLEVNNTGMLYLPTSYHYFYSILWCTTDMLYQ
jgi:hypothetical protein